VILYWLYLWHHYGQWDIYFAVQFHWAPGSTPSMSSLLKFKFFVRPITRLLMNLLQRHYKELLVPQNWNPLLILGMLVLAAVGLSRSPTVPKIYFILPVFIFLLGYLPDPFTGSRLQGMPRYQLVSVPCFLLLAQWDWFRRNGWAFYALLCMGMVLQLIYMRRYANWDMVS
jgi:hypothetical protein